MKNLPNIRKYHEVRFPHTLYFHFRFLKFLAIEQLIALTATCLKTAGSGLADRVPTEQTISCKGSAAF